LIELRVQVSKIKWEAELGIELAVSWEDVATINALFPPARQQGVSFKYLLLMPTLKPLRMNIGW